MAVRLVTLPYFEKDKIEFSDGLYYNGYAIAEILQDKDWAEDHPTELDNLRPPVYPLFLAAVYFFFGIENFKAVYFFQTLLSLIIAYFIFLMSYSIFENRKLAYISLLWSSFYIPYVRYSAIVGRELLIFFLFILAFYYGYQNIIRRSIKNYVVFLLTYLLLIHTDPRYLFFLPIIFLILYDAFGFKRAMVDYSKFILAFCFLMTPWTVRNYFYFDGIVIVSPKYLDFRTKNSFESEEDFKNSYSVKDFMMSSSGFGDQKYTIKSDIDIIVDSERKLIKKGQNPMNRTKYEIQAVKNEIYPADNYWEKRLFMIKEFWRVTKFSGDFFPYPSGVFARWSLKHNISNIIFYGSLLPFFIFALFNNFHKRRSVFTYFFLTILTQTLIHTFIWSRERYRHPIDALIIILGIHGMFLFFKYLKSLKNKIYSQ